MLVTFVLQGIVFEPEPFQMTSLVLLDILHVAQIAVTSMGIAYAKKLVLTRVYLKNQLYAPMILPVNNCFQIREGGNILTLFNRGKTRRLIGLEGRQGYLLEGARLIGWDTQVLNLTTSRTLI